MVGKLTDKDKKKIIKLHEKGNTCKQIAEEYGVHISTVKRVLSQAHLHTKPPMIPEDAKEPEGIWLTVTEKGEQKQIQVIRYEKNPKGMVKLLTPEGAEYVTKHASYGCSQEEIASAIGVKVDTLTNSRNGATFGEAYQKGLDNCRRLLRRTQFNSARDGNTAMMIWLGKNLLGQSDKVKVESKSDVSLDLHSRESVKEAARAILEREGMLDDKQ